MESATSWGNIKVNPVFRLGVFTLLVLILTACGGGGETSETNGYSSSARTTVLSSSDTDCTFGGILVEAGIDDNGNGQLDDSEVDKSEKVCNGSEGATGSNAIVSQSLEAAGTHCPYGGVRFDVGIDDNPANSKLEDIEIDSTEYVCHGKDGMVGVDGIDGVDGFDGMDGVDGIDGLDGKETQTIRFNDTNNYYALVGEKITRTVDGGIGDGKVSYSSDDPSIARVNSSTGQVTVLAAGTTNVRANKAADTIYAAAHDFYQIHAVPEVLTVGFEVGSHNTWLSFPVEADGLELYASTFDHCDLDNYSLCPGGSLNLVAGSKIENDTNTSTVPVTYWLKHGDRQSRANTVTFDHFSVREGHQVVTFNDGSGDRLWLIGGYSGGYKNDVWSSMDGINWTLEAANADFSPRSGHQIVTFNDGNGDKLWLVGGSGGGYENDVWSSSDGVNWTQQTAAAGFSRRTGHQVVTFNDGNGDKLWLIGGKDYTTGDYKNDVWSSLDGITWIEEMTYAAFSRRSNHKAITFNDGSGDKLFLIGGFYSYDPIFGAPVTVNRTDIWSTVDGITWNQETASAPFLPRSFHQIVTFNDGSGEKLWLIGGRDKEDVWSSADGVTWAEQTAAVDFSVRYSHQVVAFNDGNGDKLWLIGGRDSTGQKTDIWSSVNGVTWTEKTRTPSFPARDFHQVVTFNDGNGDKLWLTAGDSQGRSTNDVWFSVDGINWAEETASAAFPARTRHQVVTFNDGSGERLWLIGGYSSGYKNDVWSSVDGINWTQEIAAAAFPARSAHQVITFNDGSGDKLWLIGGLGGTSKNDVWSSVDGITWKEETPNAAFSARSLHSVARFNDGNGDKLWLIGGIDSSGIQSDVWSSSDGINWTRQTTAAAFPARAAHQIVNFNDGSGEILWLIGGLSSSGNRNDVWSSPDGITWTEQNAKAAFSARHGHQVIAFNDGRGDTLWLIGGNDASGDKNDVWSSTDGVNWRTTFSLPFYFY